MKKFIIVLSSIFLLFGCSSLDESEDVEETKIKDENIIVEDVDSVEEASTYTVELTETQCGMMERYQTETLSKYTLEDNKYVIELDDKETILNELDAVFNNDLMLILDGTDYLDDLYHSKDYTLFRVYFYDLNMLDVFTQNYLLYCFELGKIYNKFDGKNNSTPAMIYYKNGSDVKLQTYSSLNFSDDSF